MPRAATSVLLTTGALLLCALLLAGCGSAAALPPGPAVILKLDAPTDESRVSADYATVAGTVSPARARVAVLGQNVAVSQDGGFRTRVGLAVGANLIDVVASVPRSAGAVTAVRVIRFLLVTIPTLTGDSPKQATGALKALGLNVQTEKSSNPFSFLIPASLRVCSTSPSAGARVDPGTTVTLQASKLCGL